MTDSPTLFDVLEGAPTREDGGAGTVRGSARRTGSDSGAGVSPPSISPVADRSSLSGSAPQTCPAGGVPTGRARTNDPATSHMGAESIAPVVESECDRVLAAVRELEAAAPFRVGATAEPCPTCGAYIAAGL